VAIGINLTQRPTHDTSSEKGDAFHEDRIGLQAEEVHFSSYVYIHNLHMVIYVTF